VEGGVQRLVSSDVAKRLAVALECKVEDFLLRRQPVRPVVPDDSLLGTVSDSSLTRMWKLPQQVVRNRRMELGIPAFQPEHRSKMPPDSLLGTMSDAKLAAKYGVDWWLVTVRRRKLGILSIKARQMMPLPNELLLGIWSDRELAELWGIPVARVGHRRRKLGILCASSTQGKPKLKGKPSQPRRRRHVTN
jgi:hypothetical protein